MFTNGEHKISKLVCIIPDGSVGSPCGACRELLMELDKVLYGELFYTIKVRLNYLNYTSF